MTAAPLVGRATERAALAAASAAARERPGVLAIEGEPGIGKSRLLAELAESAAQDGATVLAARASVDEADLPYGLLTEALDPHLAAAGEHRVARLGIADPGALAALLPALGAAVVPADRHRVHRALRDLLERLAAARPLVLCLDDVHWADPASAGALAALVRRPPAAAVLLALAVREGRMPAPVAAALAGALAEDGAVLVPLGPLGEDDAVALVGETGREVHRLAGGNPFYLEQLARFRGAGGPGTARRAEQAPGEDGPAPRDREMKAGPAPRRSPSRPRWRRRWPPSSPRCRHRRARCSTAPRSPATRSGSTSPRPSPSSTSPPRWAPSTRCSRRRSCAPPAPRGASRFAIRSSGTRSTRPCPAAGGSARTPVRRRRSRGAAPARCGAPTTSSTPRRPATRRRSRC